MHDYNCICDILKFIDRNGKTAIKSVEFNTLVDSFPQYDRQTLYNHVMICKQYNLITDVIMASNTIEFFYGITPDGFNYLNNSKDCPAITICPSHRVDCQKGSLSGWPCSPAEIRTLMNSDKPSIINHNEFSGNFNGTFNGPLNTPSQNNGNHNSQSFKTDFKQDTKQTAKQGLFQRLASITKNIINLFTPTE